MHIIKSELTLNTGQVINEAVLFHFLPVNYIPSGSNYRITWNLKWYISLEAQQGSYQPILVGVNPLTSIALIVEKVSSKNPVLLSKEISTWLENVYGYWNILNKELSDDTDNQKSIIEEIYSEEEISADKELIFPLLSTDTILKLRLKANDQDCGNISIGTTSGGNDILDSQEVLANDDLTPDVLLTEFEVEQAVFISSSAWGDGVIECAIKVENK